MYDYREFKSDEFWRCIPAWKNVSREEFSSHVWQLKNTISKVEHVKKYLENKISESFYNDIIDGQKITPMNIRITPYIFSLIDWDDPSNDPLRKQFLPIGSQFLEDHPMHMEDSLNEDGDSPVELITHRYPDKVLFLPTTICPVYCSYCTRSRVVGGGTDSYKKSTYGANKKKWEKAFEYLRGNRDIEDVVLSGGDSYMLTADQLKFIGEKLIKIPNIKRVRVATKGIAIFPQKILSDSKWYSALIHIENMARSMDKSLVVHTHFSCTREITEWSRMAMDRLYRDGVVVRNQAVLQAGVNDSPEEMINLTKKLGYMNIQPYYVYQHDMVPGCEHFRTTLREAIELEKKVRGTTAGFNTPTFVCDLPGGGGKRHIASYEYYDEENGISVWKAPSVKPDQKFLYFDPIHRLSDYVQEKWKDPSMREAMIKFALGQVD